LGSSARVALRLNPLSECDVSAVGHLELVDLVTLLLVLSFEPNLVVGLSLLGLLHRCLLLLSVYLLLLELILLELSKVLLEDVFVLHELLELLCLVLWKLLSRGLRLDLAELLDDHLGLLKLLDLLLVLALDPLLDLLIVCLGCECLLLCFCLLLVECFEVKAGGLFNLRLAALFVLAVDKVLEESNLLH